MHGVVYVDSNRDGLRNVNEPGRAGVLVACGTTAFATTDARGEFTLPGCTEAIVWVRTPDGFDPTPLWAHWDSAANVELGLHRLAHAPATLTFVAAADTHISKKQTYFGERDLAQLIHVTTQVDPAPAFFTILGDITQGGEDPEFQLIEHAIASLDVPWIPVPGNHDWYDRGVQWHAHMGPDNYSFDLAGTHFVVWNMSMTDDAIEQFLRQDLMRVPRSLQIVGLTHAPPSERIAAVFHSLGGMAVITGHTHTNRVVDHSGVLELNNEPALMGGLDFTPAGYRVVTVADRHVTSYHQTFVDEPIVEIVEPIADCVSRQRITAAVQLAARTTDASARVDCDEPIALAQDGWAWSASLSGLAKGTHTLEVTAHDSAGGSTSRRMAFAVCDRAPPQPPAPLAPPLTPAQSLFVGSNILEAAPTANDRVALVVTTDLADGNRGGVTAVSVPDARILWRMKTDVPVRGRAAIAGNLAITTTIDGRVLGNDLATGAARWTYQLAPAAAHEARATFAGATIDGDVAYVGNQQELAALDVATGRARWSVVPVPEGAYTKSAAEPLVAGNLVVGTFDRDQGGIIAFDKQTGERRWTLAGEAIAVNSSPITDGERIYVLDAKDDAYAIGMDGKVLWKTQLDPAGFDWGNATVGTPALAGGLVIAPTLYTDLVALDARTGDVVWRHAGRPTRIRVTHYRGASEAGYAAGPLITGSTVWAVDTSGLLVALDLKTGTQLWTFDLHLPVLARPTLTPSGLLVASYDGSLHWLAPRPPRRPGLSSMAVAACPAYAPNRLRWLAMAGAVLALISLVRAIWVLRKRR
jgi:outer membrane protein assembly factor BamB/predicted phosphodiesterase